MSKYKVSLKDKKFEVELNGATGNVDGSGFSYELKKINGNLYLVKLNDSVYEVPVIEKGDGEFGILIEGLNYDVTVRTELEEKSRQILAESKGVSSGWQIKSPMPGLILKVIKEVGEEVKKGESLLVLEAMKMENEIKAPSNGKITKLFVQKGSKVEKNEPLIAIE